MTSDEWWLNYAMPLYKAVDDSIMMPDGTPREKRLALLVERCPWLLKELPGRIPIEESADPIKDDVPETEWTPMASSNIAAYRLDRPTVLKGEKATLFIRFKSGDEWSYADVPGETIAGFVDAGSPGGFFRAEILSRYVATKVK